MEWKVLINSFLNLNMLLPGMTSALGRQSDGMGKKWCGWENFPNLFNRVKKGRHTITKPYFTWNSTIQHAGLYPLIYADFYARWPKPGKQFQTNHSFVEMIDWRKQIISFFYDQIVNKFKMSTKTDTEMFVLVGQFCLLVVF